MKKLISLFLLVALVALAGPGVGLAAPTMKASSTNMTTLVFKLGSTNYTVNGATKKLSAAPFSKDGRTLIPIRYVIEPLGGTVSWDQAKQEVDIYWEPIGISLWVGKAIANINGELDVPIDAANPKVMPLVVKGRTFVPLRFVLQFMNADVIWGPQDKSITIRCPKPDMKTYNGTDFSIDYPEIWDTDSADSITEFTSPEGDSVMVTTDDLSTDPMTLAEYTISSINELKNQFPDIRFTESTDTVVGEYPGHQVVYTMKFESLTAKVMQAWTVIDNKAYNIIYFAQPATYDNYSQTVQDMIDSFRTK